MLIVCTVLVILFCAALEELWASKAVAELRVSPKFMLTRGDIHIVVHLLSGAPLEGAWRLTWASETVAGGSGPNRYEDDGQRTWDNWLKGYPEGRYVFTLQLWDKDGKSAGVVTYAMPERDGGQR